MGDFNNRLLFSLLFSGNFFLVGQGLDGEGESRDSSPSLPTRENPDWCSQYSVCPLPLKYYKLKIFKHLTYR